MGELSLRPGGGVMMQAPAKVRLSKAVRTAVWVFPVVLAVLGLAAWGYKSSLPDSDQQATRESTLVFVGWLGAVSFRLLLIAARAQEFLQSLAAVALPLIVVLAAAFLLFFNDQGRELGVGLMI